MIIDNYLTQYGLKETWYSLLYNLSKDERIEHNNNIAENFLEEKSFYEISDLYEYSLSFVDKLNKKQNGQYYTSRDVCVMMAKQSLEFQNGIWCDPCCGIGNLSYELLNLHPEMIHTMQFFDIDETALFVCRFLLSRFFNVDMDEIKHNFHNCSFLENNDVSYDYIIMNPPYNGKIVGEDLYITFMKKACENKGFISVTPQGFTNSINKSAIELKDKINSFSHYKIYCFDNIPGCLFCGRKKGIFNTNGANSVRAAITVCNNFNNEKLITPLMRWKNDERKKLFEQLDNNLTESIYDGKKIYKLFKETAIFLNGDRKIEDLFSKEKTEYILYIPSTPRYYITASKRFLNRSSYHELYFNNINDLNTAYLIINSALMYWWWKISDGGMTLSAETIKNLKFNSIDINMSLVHKLEEEENTCLVSKINAGKANENIKHSAQLLKELDEFYGLASLEFSKNNSYII